MKYKLNPHLFIIGFVILWVIIASITSYNLPLDSLENLAWGQLWQWGYYKHPPLQAWQQELMVLIFGRQDWPAFLLSFINIGISFYLLYYIAKQLQFSPWLAALMPVLASSIYYYTFRGIEFNANVASLPLWLAYISIFIKACDRRQFYYWILLGIIAALGLLTKYSFAILLFSSLPVILLIKKYRSILWYYGPYLSVGIMCLLLFPHILWLVDTNFLPFQYIVESVSKEQGVLSYLFNPVIFSLSQIGASSSAFLVLYIMARPQYRHVLSDKEKLAVFIIIIPLLMMMFIGWLSPAGLRSFWGYVLPMTFILLFGVLFHWELRDKKYINKLTIIILLLPCLIYVGIRLTRPYIKDAGKRLDYDGFELARQARDYWKEKTGEDKLPNVIAGEHWAIENISWYSDERPKALIGGCYYLNPWIKNINIPEKILWVGREEPNEEAKKFVTEVKLINFPWYNSRYKRKNPYYFAIIKNIDIKK